MQKRKRAIFIYGRGIAFKSDCPDKNNQTLPQKEKRPQSSPPWKAKTMKQAPRARVKTQKRV